MVIFTFSFLPAPVTMGLLKLLRSLKKSEKEARILVLGLGWSTARMPFVMLVSRFFLTRSHPDNAGKTTILKKLAEEDATQCVRLANQSAELGAPTSRSPPAASCQRRASI